MPQQELVIDYDYYNDEQCSFSDLKEASHHLTTATEEQFETIKNEKWFTRVFNMITFSKDKEKRVAHQVQNLAQAQELLIEVLVRLSDRDSKISELVSESFDKIERLSKNDLMLAQRINQLEKLSILGISKESDIEDLSETEGDILGGLLFHLMELFPEVSESQRQYANSVLNYLDVEAKQININKSINSVKTIDKKRKLLTVCLEYSFLNTLNFNFTDEIEHLIDAFDFGHKSITDVKRNIEALYNLRGVNGFIDRYGNYDEIEESFYADMTHIDVLEEDIDIERQELSLNTVLHIPKGEVKSFKNKIIYLNAFIHCEGDLELKNCTIHYNHTDRLAEITLDENADLKITNSTVICHELNEKPYIKASRNNTIILEGSNFKDCAYFIETEDHTNIRINDCELDNPFTHFIHIKNNAKASISHSTIRLNDRAPFYKTEEKSLFSYFDPIITISGITTINNCAFLGENHSNNEDILLPLFDLTQAYFEHCSFKHVANCITGDFNIKKCVFENCKHAVKSSFLSKQNEITHSLFKSCEKAIEGNHIRIEKNTFIDCKNEVISGSDIHLRFCEFYNMTHDKINVNDNSNILDAISNENANLTFGSSKESTNRIEKCIFNGIDTQLGFLIKSDYNGPKSEPVIKILDCNFKNCHTIREDEKIIKVRDVFKSLLSIRTIKDVTIENCQGLDKINKENGLLDDTEIESNILRNAHIDPSLVK